MSTSQEAATGPDLTLGVATGTLADGKMLAGHVGDDAVLLARRGDEFFAIGAACTHYNGPLVEGLMVGDTVRCPWHHACFSLRTGEALRPPALSPVACWSVEVRDDRVFVREKVAAAPTSSHGVASAAGRPQKIVIIGGGAAGFAASEMLRRHGFQGSIVMLSDDDAPPVDRPNLSKDYLAGSAPEEWVPLRGDDFYAEQGIDLRLGTTVDDVDAARTRGRARRWQQDRLRPAVARDRRRAGAIAAAGHGPAARAHAANARRLPRHHRAGGHGAARRRDRRELHRPRGGCLAARARNRGARRGAGDAARWSACWVRRWADFVRGPARGARRDLPPGRRRRRRSTRAGSR